MARSYLEFMLFDTDWKQRREIDELESGAAEMADTVGGIAVTTTRLKNRVQELSATVAVLARMLAEAGVLDPKVLQYRVEAELDALEHARHAPAGLFRCTRCDRDVPRARMVVTAQGPVCDSGCGVKA